MTLMRTLFGFSLGVGGCRFGLYLNFWYNDYVQFMLVYQFVLHIAHSILWFPECCHHRDKSSFVAHGHFTPGKLISLLRRCVLGTGVLLLSLRLQQSTGTYPCHFCMDVTFAVETELFVFEFIWTS